MIETVLALIWRRRLLASGSLRPPELRELQDRRLREAVTRAGRSIPFYRRWWGEHGVRPEEVRGIDDLDRLPVIPAEEVRRAVLSGELRSRDADVGGWLSTTGGSAGPARIPIGRRERRLWRAQGMRIWAEHGATPLSRRAQIDPHPAPSVPLFGTAWLDPALGEEALADRWRASRADWLVATPTAARRLARGLRIGGGRPARGVFLVGEPVDPVTRRRVEEALGASPISVYATTETGFLAWQCSPGSELHMNADSHWVEILDEGDPVPPGGLGEVVVTDFLNRAMPLLRCAVGDVARAAGAGCECGRALPLLGTVEGRRDGCLVALDGSRRTPLEVLRALDPLPPDRYRVEQSRPGAIELLLDRSVEDGGRLAAAALRKLLGDLDLVVKVDDLPIPLVKSAPVRSWVALEKSSRGPSPGDHRRGESVP